MAVIQIRRLMLLIAVVLSTVAGADVKVRVEEAGKATLTFEFANQPRLADVLAQLDLSDRICTRGAALYRESEKAVQRQWKRALLYDLEALGLLGERTDDTSLQRWVADVATRVAAQPVSGRKSDIVLSPYNVFPGDERNLLLENGDRLSFQHCGEKMYTPGGEPLAFGFEITLNDYAERLVRATWQAPGYMWVVYPDGAFRKAKVGYWQHEREYAESRAWLFCPVKAGLLDEINPNFNFELARWLATQVPHDE